MSFMFNNKFLIVFYIFFSIIFFQISIFTVSDSNDSKSSVKIGFKVSKSDISWHKSYQEKDKTIIPGSVKADFGKFEFRWIIYQDGIIKLVTLESAGSGELPPIEKKLLLLVLEEGNTILFQEWYPLVNVKEPYTIRPIAKVSTADLFSVLPKIKIPPTSPINQKVYTIKWGKIFLKNMNKYIQGVTKASFGTLNIYWKKEKDHNPELITLESSGAGELPPAEIKVLIWLDESKGKTIIFQERFPQLNQGGVPYLWFLTTVKTADLISGFKSLNK